jgi:hypothetical protein
VQINAVEENCSDARGKVEGGLRHIEYARDRLCAKGGEGNYYETHACGGGTRDVAGQSLGQEKTGNNYDRLYPSSLGGEEIFHWSMPFQTFHKDMKSVKKDILGLGNDLASFRCTFPQNMECGSLADIQCGGRRKDAASIYSSSIYDDESLGN